MTSIPTVTDLISAIDQHLARTEMLPTTFGKAAMGDPSFVFRLRKRRGCLASTVDRVLAYIKSQSPEAA